MDINRDMVWTSIHRHQTKLKDMGDSYLINLHHYLIKRSKLPWLIHTHATCYGFVIDIIDDILKERGLDIKDFPTELPYELDGKWFYDGEEATESQVLAYKLSLPIPQVKKDEISS